MGRYCLSVCILCFTISIARAADLTLVENGAANYAIAVRQDCTAAEQLAASEVARYIKQITGADMKIVRNDNPSGRAIVIGKSRELQPPAGYSIDVGDQIRITADSDPTTLNAAYRFLDLLGCRFLAPDLEHYKGASCSAAVQSRRTSMSCARSRWRSRMTSARP